MCQILSEVPKSSRESTEEANSLHGNTWSSQGKGKSKGNTCRFGILDGDQVLEWESTRGKSVCADLGMKERKPFKSSSFAQKRSIQAKCSEALQAFVMTLAFTV